MDDKSFGKNKPHEFVVSSSRIPTSRVDVKETVGDMLFTETQYHEEEIRLKIDSSDPTSEINKPLKTLQSETFNKVICENNQNFLSAQDLSNVIETSKHHQ